MTFAKLALTFNIAHKNEAFLALDDKSGIAVKTDEKNSSSLTQVFMRVSKIVAESLASDKNESVASCRALQGAISRYSGSLAKQAQALVNLSLLKAASEDSSAQLALSAKAFTEQLMRDLEELCNHFAPASENAKLFPKQPFDELRNKTLVYLSKQLGPGVDSNILYKLDALFTKVSVVWWEAKAKKRGQEQDFSLLTETPEPLCDQHVEALCYPRNILYIEKMLLDNVVSHVTTSFLSARKIVHLQTRVERIYKENGALLCDIDDDELGFVELGLFLQVKQAALRMQKHGVEYSTDALIKKLYAYSQEKDHSKDFYNLCLDILKINELLYNIQFLSRETAQLHAVGLSLLKEPRQLDAISYLPRKRLAYLTALAAHVFADLRQPEEFDLKKQLENEAEAGRILEILRASIKKFLTKEDTDRYKQLAQRIAEFRILRGNHAEHLRAYERLQVNGEVWPHLDLESYKKQFILTEAKLTTVPLQISVLLGEAQKATPDKGYTVTLPARKPQPTKKKKKSVSIEKTPRPATPPLVESRSPSPTVMPVVSKPPAIAASKPPAYAARVHDWFCKEGSKRDPFVKEAKYRDGVYTPVEKSRVRMYHNLGLALDQCLNEAEETTDQAVLLLYKAAKRLQLVVELLKDGRSTKGVLTYTFDRSGRVFHRWFTPKNSRELLNPGVEKGWQVLDEELENAEVIDLEDLMADDGSYIESITPNSITVSDPKNTLIIRVARLK